MYVLGCRGIHALYCKLNFLFIGVVWFELHTGVRRASIATPAKKNVFGPMGILKKCIMMLLMPNDAAS